MKAFECRMCGACCYGKGGIIVGQDETKNISRFLKITPKDFIDRFCENRNGRIHIKTGQDRFCIFYNKEIGCQIYSVRPRRCSHWPFYPGIVNDKDNWEAMKEACPGINPQASFEKFVMQSKIIHCNTFSGKADRQ